MHVSVWVHQCRFVVNNATKTLVVAQPNAMFCLHIARHAKHCGFRKQQRSFFLSFLSSLFFPFILMCIVPLFHRLRLPSWNYILVSNALRPISSLGLSLLPKADPITGVGVIYTFYSENLFICYSFWSEQHFCDFSFGLPPFAVILSLVTEPFYYFSFKEITKKFYYLPLAHTHFWARRPQVYLSARKSKRRKGKKDGKTHKTHV